MKSFADWFNSTGWELFSFVGAVVGWVYGRHGMRRLMLAWLAFLIVVLSVVLSACSTTQLHIASNTLMVADWAQTRYIATHPEQYKELNPTLPSHPSLGQVNKHFVGALLLNNGVYYALGDEGKRKWSLVITGLEGATVFSNASIGVKFQW